MKDKIFFSVDDIRNYVTRFFAALNVPYDDACIAADIILAADLRGIPSHGVIRLHNYYGKHLKSGSINPLSPTKVLQKQPNSLVIDGANGLGLVIAFNAMKQCIDMAEQFGIAIVTVRNSNHFGIAGYYAMMALSHDMIGISLTNTQPLVSPTYGRKRMVGTNPIAVAVPAGEEDPFVLDMATSIVTNGMISVHQKFGEEIPFGWAIDQKGEITNRPSDVIDGGSLLPLGGLAEMRGYKGFGLSMLVDILSGVLAGSAFGEKVGIPDCTHFSGVGHFFAAIKIENFRPLDQFKMEMDEYIRALKCSPKLSGKDRIFIPGEKEFDLTDKHYKWGLPIYKETVDQFIQKGETYGIPFDLLPISGTFSC